MNIIKLTIKKYDIYLKNLQYNTKKALEDYKRTFYRKKIDNIETKYNNDYNLLLYDINKKINDVTDLLEINEIINNSYLNFENNYYNNRNFSTFIMFK